MIFIPDYRVFAVNQYGEYEEVYDGYYVSGEEEQARRERKEIARKVALREAAQNEYIQKYGHFTFFRYQPVQDNFLGCSVLEVARLFYASTMLPYQSDILTWKNGKIISVEALQKLLSVSDSTYRRFIIKMQEIEVLKIENELVHLNSDIFSRQHIRKWRGLNQSFIRIYHEAFRYLYEKLDGRQRGKLGYLIKLIPYLNIQTNIICAVPQADYINCIEPLDIQQICVLVGYSSNQASRFLKEMQQIQFEDGQPVFIYNDSDRVAKINPRLFYGGNIWEDILREFESS